LFQLRAKSLCAPPRIYTGAALAIVILLAVIAPHIILRRARLTLSK
jgi:hypothetical protein